MNIPEVSIKTNLFAGIILLAGISLLGGCATNASPNAQGMGQQDSMSSNTHNDMNTSSTTMNRYGGPAYTGKPALPVTVALIKAGGGAGDFSLVTALNNMLGKSTVHAEVTKLTKQYGEESVQNWVDAIDFYVNDTLSIAKSKGMSLPPPADLSGKQLAMALVKAGTTQDGTFWAGHLFDKAVSHSIHVQLMNDADDQYSAHWDANAHKVTNQAFYDVAQALGMNKVKLAAFH